MGGKYDVIIAGAGPAGLFAALELTKHGRKVLILDKGRAIDKRVCPLKNGARECLHCQPCNVVCGWGGAGAFSDGKLTLTPEFGGNLEEYCGRKELLSLIDEADKVYLEHGASQTLFKPSGELAKRVIARALQSGLDIIPATMRHMGTDRSKFILGDIYETIKDLCEVRMNTTVDRVLTAEGKTAGVALASGEEIYAPMVLLSPGREGAAWMEKTVKALGLEIESLPVDIGVRVEIPAAGPRTSRTSSTRSKRCWTRRLSTTARVPSACAPTARSRPNSRASTTFSRSTGTRTARTIRRPTTRTSRSWFRPDSQSLSTTPSATAAI